MMAAKVHQPHQIVRFVVEFFDRSKKTDENSTVRLSFEFWSFLMHEGSSASLKPPTVTTHSVRLSVLSRWTASLTSMHHIALDSILFSSLGNGSFESGNEKDR